MAWCYVNGLFSAEEDAVFSANNRSLRYGDGFFETIKFSRGMPLYFNYHFDRIVRSLNLLQMQAHSTWNQAFFEQKIKELALKNECKNAVFRLVFYREGEGNYLPSNSECNFFITCRSIDNYTYPVKSITNLGIYKELYKTSNFTSILKTSSANIYVLASIFAQQNKLDDCLLVNEQNHICEAISSNVFLVKANRIITPPLSEYCVDGVMRKVILEIAGNYGYQCDEIIIEEQDLYLADELFLTNAVNGIMPVEEFRGKQYGSVYTDALSTMLNDSLSR